MLERLVHGGGDPSLAALLQFSPGACEAGRQALQRGAVILTDTAMAAAAVRPMAARTAGNQVRCLLDWAPSVTAGIHPLGGGDGPRLAGADSGR